MELTFHLDSFEGPLDLLLHLISKNKVSVYDIPIALILEQYMEVLNEAQAMDMDVAGDFIAMAAQLIYIKSKMLLPVYEEEEEDPRIGLVEMLLEYQRMKEAAFLLRGQSEEGRDIYVKPPEIREKEQAEYHHHVDDLVAAAHNILDKNVKKLPPPATAFQGIVGREAVPVGLKITAILKRFLKHTRLRFDHLFADAKSRSEIVATFLAVLELSKTRRILLEGDGDNMELYLTDSKELI